MASPAHPVLALARAFSGKLRAWLPAHVMAELVARNAARRKDSICYSHDYCDAHEAMLQAFEGVFGRPMVMDGGEDFAGAMRDGFIADEAWALAKAHGFNPSAPMSYDMPEGVR